MSDSSENNEIFGDDSDMSDNSQDERDAAQDEPPAYVNTDEFKKFVEQNKINVNNKFGYFYIHTYKPFYFPGEIIRGSLILDFFNNLPKKYK